MNTILHSHHVNDLEGVSTVSLDTVNKQVIWSSFYLLISDLILANLDLEKRL